MYGEYWKIQCFWHCRLHHSYFINNISNLDEQTEKRLLYHMHSQTPGSTPSTIKNTQHISISPLESQTKIHQDQHGTIHLRTRSHWINSWTWYHFLSFINQMSQLHNDYNYRHYLKSQIYFMLMETVQLHGFPSFSLSPSYNFLRFCYFLFPFPPLPLTFNSTYLFVVVVLLSCAPL